MPEYIKRSDALKVIETANSMVSSLLEATMQLCMTMDRIDAADVVAVRHGRWLIKTVRGDKRTVCSECLSETGTCYEENYCPNCGALMDKDGAE